MSDVDARYLGLTANQLAKIATDLKSENARLRELVSDYSDCLDTALWLASDAGYPVMPARDKFLSLEKRKREMGIEVPDGEV